MSVPKNLTKICSQLSVVSLLALPNIAFGQVVASDGVSFGSGGNDPYPFLKKQTGGSKNLQLDLESNGAFSIFSNLDSSATFRAGEGNSADVEAGKWYRIAMSNGAAKRANALFNLRTTTNGTHGNITFRTGMSYATKSKMAFTLLSNSRHFLPVFSEVRYLSNGAYDTFYLEVKIAKDAAVSYSIMENLAAGGWVPVDWEETPSIPSGYTETKYDLDKLFVVAGQTPVLSVDRTTGVAIDGGLTLNGSSVMTEASLNTVFGNSLELGVNSSAPGVNAFAGGNNSVASGDYSFAYGFYTSATGRYAFSTGFGNSVSGSYGSAFGAYNNVSGSFSMSSGVGSSVTGSSSASFGVNNSVEGNSSVAFGAGNVASAEYSFVTGSSNIASGIASSAFGKDGQANGAYSMTVGINNRSNGNASFAMGSNNTTEAGVICCASFGLHNISSGVASMTIGGYNKTHGVYSLAHGNNSEAFGDYAFATGDFSKISQYAGMSIGRYNEDRKTHIDSSTAWQGDAEHSVFEIGIGSDENNRKNAMTVMQDGTIELGKDAVTNEVPLKVKSDGSVILSKAQGDISMGIYGTPAP